MVNGQIINGQSRMANSAIQAFLRKHRQATLAVSADNIPHTAMVSYVWDSNPNGALVHLSNLAPHKRQLINNPQCSLLVAEPDDGRAELMSLARVILQGTAAMLDKPSADYAMAKATFLARLPSAEIMFGLPDFDLFRIAFTGGRYIAGFGRALVFTADEI